MRTFIFLFCATIFAIVPNNVVSQNSKIKIEEDKTLSVDEVFDLIMNQTDYSFFYEEGLFKGFPKVNVKKGIIRTNKLLSISLSQGDLDIIVTKNKDIFIKENIKSFLISENQKIEVSGRIEDINGQPLPGANIIEKGTNNGTQSDFDGNFSIALKDENAVIIISYLGFITQEIEVNNQASLSIILVESSAKLDEIIVVGYGSVKKSDLTGSVVSADIEKFENQPNVSIVQSLQGSVAGLNVGTVTGAGGEPSLSVRGRNTFARDENNRLIGNDPLIVLDGVIYRGNIIDINPSDIKSVNILRDASSKAIYGSQAANGVIIITTKIGKKKQKPSFTLSSYYTTSTPAKRLHPLDRAGFIARTSDQFWEEAFNGPDYTTPNPSFDPATLAEWATLPQLIEGFNDGTNTDWLDLLTQTSFIQNTNINMTGRTDKTGYFLSGGYTKEDGWALNDSYDRINLRANFDTQVTDWLNIGMQTFMSSGDYSGEEANLRNAHIFLPLIKPYNDDGTINYFPQGNDINPLASLDVDNFDKRLNLFGNVSATIKVPYVEGLTYKINYSTNYRTRKHFNFDPNAINFTGEGFKEYRSTQDQTLDNTLSYVKTINDKHDINATFVYGYEEREGESIRTVGAGFINQSLGYNNLRAANTISIDENNTDAWDERSHYQMGRLNYKFDNKYMATFTIRRDGFSGFGANKKFGNFPSMAFAWVASEEDFISKALPWANNLKLRVSYGKTGNRTVGRYGTLAPVSGSFQYIFGDGGDPAFAQRIEALANSNIGWETTTGLNLGLDFGILNNKITGSIEYYSSKTEDILVSILIPRITGFSSVRGNIGEVDNKGLNLSINSVNVKNDNFEWNTSFVFSKNNNKIASILGRDNDQDGDGIEDDLVANSLFIGESIGTIYNYDVTGIYQIGDNIPSGLNPGNYIVNDQIDGVDGVSGDDRKILGHTEPAYRFSIFNGFKYKNWGLNVFINSVQGGKDGYLGDDSPKWAEFGWQAGTVARFNSVREFDYWSPSNPNAQHSGLRYSDNNPSNGPRTYSDRSFVRLQDVSLSYNVPKALLEKVSIDNLRVFVSGKNLHTWTDWKGIDPEAGIGLVPGALPVMKSYTFGINLTF